MIFLLPAALAAGCVSTSGEIGRATVARIASAGFTASRHDLTGLPVATWFRAGVPGKTARPLHVYVEGDGNAWETRERVSADPTPGDPVGFRLAAADSSGADVLYLARPCQFVTLPSDGCRPAVWTGARFSEAVIEALNAALDEAARPGRAAGIVLVGYSGGGVAAALMATERPDVIRLVTVAAPLDHAAWTGHHGVSPLAASLNPMDRLNALRGIDQLHLAGARDTIVPPWIVARYVDALATPASATLRVKETYDHHCCWTRDWSSMFNPEAQTGIHR